MENHTPEADIVVFNGVKFRRYPASRHHGLRNYYLPSYHNRRKGYGSLHVEIWKSAHGPIPEGCHIHHRDGNPLNNSVENLECLSPGDHLRRHYLDDPERVERSREHCHRIQPLSHEWCRTEEGREVLSRQVRRFWERREPVEKRCEQCGSAYQTRATRPAKYCSGKCRSKARYESGAAHEERACVVCGKAFMCARHHLTRSCSRECRNKVRSLIRDATP